MLSCQMQLIFSVLVTLIPLSSLVVGSPEVTEQRRWITAQPGDQDSPYFVGYLYDSGSWVGWDCNPGSTFTSSGDVAACVTLTDTDVDFITSCANTSVLVFAPTNTPYTCTGEACNLGIIYDDLAATKSMSIISCQGTVPNITFYMYRATTHPLSTTMSSTLATTTSAPASPSSTAQGIPSSTSLSPAANTAATSPDSSSNNSQSNNIAIGVGIGVGIPAILVSIGAWWFPRRRSTRESSPTAQGAVMSNSDDAGGGGGPYAVKHDGSFYGGGYGPGVYTGVHGGESYGHPVQQPQLANPNPPYHDQWRNQYYG